MSDGAGADYPWDPAEQERMRQAGEEVPPMPEPPAVAAPGPGGGMQAARQGDMTTHLGSIGPVVANQTVRIGGMPAAVVGDPQTCPMYDGATPHTGGAIISGSSVANIGNMPAARAGDDTQCAGTTGQIALGCMTVYIGDQRMGGSGGGSAAGAPAASAVAAAPATVESVPASHAGPLTPEETPEEPTWIGIRLIDHDGEPVPNENFQVTLDDGTVLAGVTDAQGYTRFDGLQPSSGDVAFTGIPDNRDRVESGGGADDVDEAVSGIQQTPRPAGGEELNPSSAEGGTDDV